MLKLCHLKGLYSGENIVKAIIAVIETYKIINKIGYFILDNAGLNDTYVSAIIKQLNIKDIKEHCRLYYFSYVLNLSKSNSFWRKS